MRSFPASGVFGNNQAKYTRSTGVYELRFVKQLLDGVSFNKGDEYVFFLFFGLEKAFENDNFCSACSTQHIATSITYTNRSEVIRLKELGQEGLI